MSGIDTILVIGNVTLVCQDVHSTSSIGLWRHSNPLHYTTPLLFMQLSLISIVSRIIDFCLRPLGQSTIVSQIFGGIVFGPSLLGHGKMLTSRLFPLRGTLMLDTVATFGLMFFFFAIGVKMDPVMMLQPKKRALTISASVFFFTLALPTSLAFIFKRYLSMTESLSHSLPYIALSQSITAFPVIACLLTELRILNTDLGRLALSASMFCDVIGITMTAAIFSMSETKAMSNNVLTSFLGITSTIALIVVITFIIRPMIVWIMNHTPEGHSVKEGYIIGIFLMVVVSGFFSEMIGQHFILGPMILGLAVPEGPPLGSALVTKTDALITGLLYPTFMAVSGLKTNIFEIHFRSLWVIGVIVLFGCLVKIFATILPGIYNGMPIREGFTLGLALNAKGINELIMYNLWRDAKILKDEEFTLAVISVLLVTAIITPLIRFLYDPTKQYIALRRNTIQHVKRESELRILVCIHNQDSVPTIINLLEVSHASEESPVSVIMLILVKLIGRTTPTLLSHQSDGVIDAPNSRTGQILSALKYYALHNEGYTSVQSYSAISHYETMHDDICRVASDKQSTVVIVPFHKHYAIDGSVGSVNRAIRNMNLLVLEMAPCSVGILVDRGVLNGTVSILATRSIYHVGVLFIGGADDAESLAYGARMVRHGNVNLTVIRFLLFGSENARDRKRESDFIDTIRHENSRNPRFVYLEEVVRDGVGLAGLIRGIEDSFDLVIVGRHHQDSPLLSGLDQWSECPELGVIGDMLASADFGSTASILVVQQQRVGGNLIGRPVQPVVNDRDQVVHDVEARTSSARSNPPATWAITMDRGDY